MFNSLNAKAFGLGLMAAASLISVGPVRAQSDDDLIRVPVSYADLDIHQEAGAKVLLQRIKSASIIACGDVPDLRLLGERAAFEHCRQIAVEDAVAKVNSPLLALMAGNDEELIRLANR